MKAVKIDFLGIINKFRPIYIVEALLILVGIVLRLKLYLYNPSFFCDECALGFNIINSSYSELFSPLYINQCAPPFFLVISKFILNLSHQYGNIYTQDLALRAFPFICSIISLPLFAIYLNKITNNKIFVWVCVLMLSINNCAISYSIQFKQYSCELMFSLILLLIFESFDINKLSKKTLSLYSFVFCLSIWLSYSTFFILATVFLYFILKCFSSNFRNELKTNLFKLCIIAIPFILNLVIFYSSYLQWEYDSPIYPFMQYFWSDIVPGFFTINNFLFLYPHRLQELLNVPFASNSEKFLIILLLLNIIILFSQKQNFKFKTKFFVLTPILLPIIASFLHIYPFINKFSLYSLPLYIILFCQIIFLIKPNKILKAITILILAVVSIYNLRIPIYTIYLGIYKQPVRNTMEFILQNKIPANKIIFANSGYNYYGQSSSFDTKLCLFDPPYQEFDKSVIPLNLKKYPLGDYYIFSPLSNIVYEYYIALLAYLNNDKHIKILNTYTYNGFIYIIHINKISNYD